MKNKIIFIILLNLILALNCILSYGQTDSLSKLPENTLDSLNQARDSIINVHSQIAESSKLNNPFYLSTPFDAVYLHYSNLQTGNYNPEVSSKALFVRAVNEEMAKDLAIKLMRIFNGNGLILRLNKIPRYPNYKDSVSGLQRYVLFEKFPQIYVEKIGNIWLYSKETVDLIPELYEETYPYDFYSIEDNLPKFTLNQILGVKLWKLIGIILLVVFVIILYKVLSWIFGFLFVKIITKTKYGGVADKFIKPLAKPFSLLIINFILIGFLPSLHLPIAINFYILLISNLFIPIIVTIILYKLADLIADILSVVALKTSSKVDDQLVPLARKAIKIVVIIFGILYLLNTLNVDITPLVAGVSIGGLAFALAAQETIRNLFGSITIITDQPFTVGDWIIFSGGEGTVEEIGMRSTRIRSFNNSVITIPNGRISDMTIDNMGVRIYRRYNTNIAITYETPPDLIDAFVEGLKEIVATHPKTRKDYYQIYLNNFGDSSLNILFNIFFDVPDWMDELQARQEILIKIISLANELGVRFAFPTNTINIETFPEKKSLIPEYKENREGFFLKMRSFFQKNRD